MSLRCAASRVVVGDPQLGSFFPRQKSVDAPVLHFKPMICFVLKHVRDLKLLFFWWLQRTNPSAYVRRYFQSLLIHLHIFTLRASTSVGDFLLFSWMTFKTLSSRSLKGQFTPKSRIHCPVLAELFIRVDLLLCWFCFLCNNSQTRQQCLSPEVKTQLLTSLFVSVFVLRHRPGGSLRLLVDKRRAN